jgi:Flp pilus assembly protein protease CpaA
LNSDRSIDRKTAPYLTLWFLWFHIIPDITTYLHAIWYSLLQISLALFFLFQQLGASCLGGVCIIVIMIPLTKYIAQWMGGMQKKLMKAKDARVELNSEGELKLLCFCRICA